MQTNQRCAAASLDLAKSWIAIEVECPLHLQERAGMLGVLIRAKVALGQKLPKSVWCCSKSRMYIAEGDKMVQGVPFVSAYELTSGAH